MSDYAISQCPECGQNYAGWACTACDELAASLAAGCSHDRAGIVVTTGIDPVWACADCGDCWPADDLDWYADPGDPFENSPVDFDDIEDIQDLEDRLASWLGGTVWG